MHLIKELIPLLAFFGCYKITNSIVSASLLLCAIAIGENLWRFYKKLPITKMNLVVAGILLFTTAISLLTGNSNFIKSKPTILYLFLACIIIWAIITKRNLIKNIIQKTSPDTKISPRVARYIHYQWLCFCLVAAITNEITWRTYSEEIWINLKIFVLPAASFILILGQFAWIIAKAKKP